MALSSFAAAKGLAFTKIEGRGLCGSVGMSAAAQGSNSRELLE